jgi:hypothetical protein
MPRAGATGNAGGAAGGKARSTDAQTNTRGSNILLDSNLPGQNSREKFFKRRLKIVLEGSNRFENRIGLKNRSPRPPVTTEVNNFTFSVLEA